MNAQTVAKSLQRRILISVALLACGTLVFVLGANYYSVLPTNDSQPYRALLAVAFLAAAIALRSGGATQVYGQIAYAFFVATMAFFVTSMAAVPRDALLRATDVAPNTPQHMAFAKVFEASLVVAVILVLGLLWGWDLRSLYISKGRLGLSLFVGLSLMTINAATGIATGASLGHAGDRLVARLPWALLFSLANGLMEELWFRGLFLRRFASVIGVPGSIVVTSILFTVMHGAASYMNLAEAIIFQVIIFPMALLFGYLMHKTDNLWGSALYHAGSDVFLFYLMGW